MRRIGPPRSGPEQRLRWFPEPQAKQRQRLRKHAFRWECTIALKPGNPFSHVHLKQWTYLPEGTQTMFTRAIVTKLGLTIGEVSESFQRAPTTDR